MTNPNKNAQIGGFVMDASPEQEFEEVLTHIVHQRLGKMGVKSVRAAHHKAVTAAKKEAEANYQADIDEILKNAGADIKAAEVALYKSLIYYDDGSERSPEQIGLEVERRVKQRGAL